MSKPPEGPVKRWNVMSPFWSRITIPLALLATLLAISLLDRDQRQTLQVVTSCMLGIMPVILFHLYRRDLQRRDQTERALRESEERYRRLVELSPNAIAVHHRGKIAFINSAGAALLGASSPKELIGKSVVDFVEPAGRSGVESRLKDAREFGSIDAIREQRLVRLDGRTVEAEVTVIPFSFEGEPAVQIICRDLTERKQVEEALEETKRNYETLVNSVDGIVWEADAKTFQFTFVSKQAERLLGYPAEQWLREKTFWKDHLHPEDRDRAVDYCEKATAQLRSHDFDYRMIAADGRAVWLRDIVSVIAEDGQPVALRGIMLDVSEQKRMHEQLAAYSKELKSTNEELVEALRVATESAELKSQFLANVSHEIRTPMNGVIGTASLLLDTDLTADQRELAQIVRNSGEALLRIVNDILDFSKIEAKFVKLEIIEFRPRDTVEDVMELLGKAADAKGVEVICQIGREVPELLKGDPSRLRQVLINLVSNAVKFTNEGEIAVTVALEARSEGKARLRFEVSDTGIGVGAVAQEYLFQPFRQADGSTTRKYGGTGLGLAISKRLVEMMGGEVGVSSTQGNGATFWFTVALDECAVTTVPDPRAAALQGTRALVVDDNARSRKALSYLLETWGIGATEATGGRAALELLLKKSTSGEPFDFVFADLHMPEMDGLELAAHIKSTPPLAGARVVILSAHNHNGIRQRAQHIGVDGHLAKPVRQAHLLRLLENIARVSDPDREANPSSLIHLDEAARDVRAQRRVLVVEDNVVNQQVIARILEKLGCRVDTVGNGKEALQATRNAAYSVIFMDCQMPEMDGFSATREIRNTDGDGAHTPIIAITASAMHGDREKCLAAGMDDYISKPVRLEDIVSVLEKWSGSAQSSLPLRSHNR